MRRTGSRMAVGAGVLLAGLWGVLLTTPASALVPPGSLAQTFVGGPTANCTPPATVGFAPAAGTVNGIAISGAGRCTPLAADAEGYYTLPGGSPLNFTAECANTDGVVTTHGGVVVPAGTRISGGPPVGVPTTVETLNTPVVFPGGQTAILNQQTSTPTSVTRTAIVFTSPNGPTIGRVICGAFVYPLAVEPGGDSGAIPAVVAPSSAASGGGVSGLMLLGGGLALAVLVAQLAVVRRIRRNRA